MPKAFDKLLNSIKSNLKGKINPRTKKPYTDSEIHAIAITQWKKKTGKAPKREDSPKWYCEGNKEIREDVRLEWSEQIEFEGARRTRIDEPLKISGMAINETTTRNKIKYVVEELEKAFPSLIGKPILNSHNNTNVENVLGKVIDARIMNGGIWYSAEIDPDERKIINKIKKGYLDKVSIGAHVKELIVEVIETDNGKQEEIYTARGIDFVELSLVSVPGDKDTSISLTHALSESFNDIETNDISNEKLENKEDETMEIETKTLQDEVKALKEEIGVLKDEKAKIDEQSRLQDLKELIKKEILEELKPEDKPDEKDSPDEVKTETESDEEEKIEDKPEDSDESKGKVPESVDSTESTKNNWDNYELIPTREGLSFYKGDKK